MNINRLLLALFFCGLLPVRAIFAQGPAIPSQVWKETGLPYIQNFSPKEYNGGTQNFSIVQDRRGILYVGNNWGVLVYDAVSWSLITTPNRNAVRSLCRVGDRIYVGGVGELGYLESDSLGQYRYVSLLSILPADHRNFKDVYDILAFDGDVYFRTRYTLFRLSDDSMHIWESKEELGTAFTVNGDFFMGQRKAGLGRFVRDSLRVIEGGEIFAELNVTAMLPFNDSEILISTLNNGLFLYDGSRIRKKQTSADELLYQNQIRDGRYLSGGLYVFGTSRGAVFMDASGAICQVVNKSTGLLDELIISLNVDHQNGLWLALNNGIARVEMPAPVSRFYDESGIESFVGSVVRHNGRLYTTTDRGVSYLEGATFPSAVFKPVPGISTLSWSLLSVGERLLAGTQEAIYEITDSGAVRINSFSAIRMHRSATDSSLIFAGLLEGIAVMRLVEDTWLTMGRISGIDERIISITEDDNGALWLGTQSEGILKIDSPRLDISSEETGGSGEDAIVIYDAGITRFGREHGLPSGPTTPSRVGKHLVFKTVRGLRRFDDARRLFVPDSTFGVMFADTLCWINDIRADHNGSVWIVAGKGERRYLGSAIPQPDGAYAWYETPFLRISDLGRVYFSFPERDGTVWFGGAEGIVRYTPAIPKDYRSDYATIIRRVSGINVDTVYYDGAFPAELPHPEIAYENNSVRFAFAAMSLENPAANRYQVKLEGFDANWSNWSGENKKDYTGLSAGTYSFRVRGKNVYEHLSREASFSFTILRPWYQTWWAFTFYFIFAGMIIFGIVKYRVRHLEMKTLKLESVIAERTKVIREQAEKLQELDKLKSRFYANISHEFRTPLTLILGPLEERIAGAKSKADKDELGMMYRNARRLLSLILELLDLSRLESGKMKLKTGKGDFIAFLKGIVMSFASLAEQKKITLAFESSRIPESSQNSPAVYFDPDKIEKIFTNLLSNAFKFTPDGGEIRCHVKYTECGPEVRPGNKSSGFELECRCIEISIRDTGIGIPADRLPYIFDRFYQVDSTSTREHEGTGIGLALTKELVLVHHGSIEVESEEARGTTFTVRLPLGNKHLTPDEIVDSDNLSTPDAGPMLEIESDDQVTEIPIEQNRPDSGGDTEDIILIVDDHPDVRNYLRKHLEKSYTITEAHDGRQGLETAIEIIPDLVISDVMMPKLDGNQLCAAIKTNEKTSHIPVILLTAKAEEHDKLSGLETGADDYLTKPFSAKQLQVRVRNLIRQRRLLRARFVREGILQPRDVAVTSVDEAFLHRLMCVIEENLSDEHFGVTELSEKIFMGARQLQRKVRGLTGKSPVEVIRSVRLNRARYLLERKAGTVTEIALQVGFTNLSHFAKVFREEFGKLPSEIE
jgi:signal transduction histidine kinase/DNA-binding response OmpR family regulator